MQFIVYLFNGVRYFTKALEEQRVLLENPQAYLLPVLHADGVYHAFIIGDFNESEIVTTHDLTRLRHKYVTTPLGRYARVVFTKTNHELFTKTNHERGIVLLKETVGELDLGATSRRLFFKTPLFVCAPRTGLGRGKDAGTA